MRLKHNVVTSLTNYLDCKQDGDVTLDLAAAAQKLEAMVTDLPEEDDVAATPPPMADRAPADMGTPWTKEVSLIAPFRIVWTTLRLHCMRRAGPRSIVPLAVVRNSELGITSKAWRTACRQCGPSCERQVMWSPVQRNGFSL